MCGIFGFASDNISNPGEFWAFADKLCHFTQRRGKQATGFSAIVNGKEWITDKRPTSGEEFVNNSSPWRSLRGARSVSLIGHTRQATAGSPSDNHNNHPFHSSKYSVAHNGGIKLHEDIAKELDIKLETDCDSELLLHLIDSDKNVSKGIANAFTEVDSMAWMAVCALERENRKIHLFKDAYSPCCIITVPRWNVTIFCSTLGIIEDAMVATLGSKGAAHQSGVLVHDNIPEYSRVTITPDGELEEENLENMIGINSTHGVDDRYANSSRWHHNTSAYSGGTRRSTSSTETRRLLPYHIEQSEDEEDVEGDDIFKFVCNTCKQFSEVNDYGNCDDCADDERTRNHSSSEAMDDDEALARAVASIGEDGKTKVFSSYKDAVEFRKIPAALSRADKRVYEGFSEMSWTTKESHWDDMSSFVISEMQRGEWKACLEFLEEKESETSQH